MRAIAVQVCTARCSASVVFRYYHLVDSTLSARLGGAALLVCKKGRCAGIAPRQYGALVTEALEVVKTTVRCWSQLAILVSLFVFATGVRSKRVSLQAIHIVLCRLRKPRFFFRFFFVL